MDTKNRTSRIPKKEVKKVALEIELTVIPPRIIPSIMIRVTKEDKYIPIVKSGRKIYTGNKNSSLRQALEEAHEICKEIK